jgi:excisionase family DNA binding protein
MNRTFLKRSADTASDSRPEKIAFSAGEVCRALGIGRTHLYELIKTGALETVKLGSRRLITRDAIDRLLAANKVSP